MNKLSCIALFTGLLLLGLVARPAKANGAAQPSFSITITAPQSTVKASSEVELEVVLKNISQRNINVSEMLGGADLNYDIQVRDSQGKLAQETAFGLKLHGKDPTYQGQHGSIVARTLAPGSTHESKAYLNKMYSLPPGAYAVQVSRRDPATNQVVNSNTITLTVIP